jgi:hypothetical protein
MANLTTEVTLFADFIERRQRTGITDMPKVFELFARDVFNALEGGQFKDLNRIVVDFPAVDIGDYQKRIAVQATLTADSKKVNKTLAAFQKASLQDEFDRLIVFGAKKAGKPILPPFCVVMDLTDMLAQLTSAGDPDKVQEVLDSLAKHFDYRDRNPLNDLENLKIVLNFIDRNAVKHSMFCEGPAHEMRKGFNEITELIGKGTVARKRKAKQHDDYTDGAIRDYLTEVKKKVSKILAVVNTNTQNEMTCLNQQDMREIDDLKEELIELSNNIAASQGINFRMELVRR